MTPKSNGDNTYAYGMNRDILHQSRTVNRLHNSHRPESGTPYTTTEGGSSAKRYEE